MIINIAILTLATGATLTGFYGDKVTKSPSSKWFVRRITWLGWTFLLCVALGFSCGVYKEVVSFEGQANSAYSSFFPLVHDLTGYSQTQWNKMISYRLSLRFLLQKMYWDVLGKGARDLESMESMEYELGQTGALSNDLCGDLDLLRQHTQSAEWASGQKLVDTNADWVRSNGDRVLKELNAAAEKAKSGALVAYPQSTCGVKPGAARPFGPRGSEF
jgi:hypothetical protein